MKNASFQSSGFRDLERQLAKLAAGLGDDRVRRALQAGGQIIAAEAQRLAPYKTGRLHDSIGVTDDRDARVYGKVNGAGLSVYVGPVGSTEEGDVYYAKFQEFGTINHGGKPFMRPAIASKRPEAERLVMAMLAADVLKLAQ